MFGVEFACLVLMDVDDLGQVRRSYGTKDRDGNKIRSVSNGSELLELLLETAFPKKRPWKKRHLWMQQRVRDMIRGTCIRPFYPYGGSGFGGEDDSVGICMDGMDFNWIRIIGDWLLLKRNDISPEELFGWSFWDDPDTNWFEVFFWINAGIPPTDPWLLGWVPTVKAHQLEVSNRMERITTPALVKSFSEKWREGVTLSNHRITIHEPNGVMVGVVSQMSADYHETSAGWDTATSSNLHKQISLFGFIVELDSEYHPPISLSDDIGQEGEGYIGIPYWALKRPGSERGNPNTMMLRDTLGDLIYSDDYLQCNKDLPFRIVTDASELMRKKKRELIDLCKERSLVHSGTKKDMVARLTMRSAS